jgi:hypothetical protein
VSTKSPSKGKVYGFVEQLEMGKSGEAILDEYFGQWYDIRNVTLAVEKSMGVDREFRRKGDDEMWYVEYKTDSRTQDTGNIFVETMSNDTLGRYGWAWTTKADLVMYFAMPDTIYVFKPNKVRDMITTWRGQFGLRKIPNRGYKSHGIPVPEGEFAQVCEAVRRLT